MTIYYPARLPRGLRGSRSSQLVSPLQRSQLTSGRARQRRKYTSVPEMVKVSWLFTSVEAQAFVAWFRDQVKDGALWFECPLKTPMGYSHYTARFADVYDGPSVVGPNLWSYSADLELMERAAPPIGEGWFPNDILDSEIFDFTINREWPQV